MPDSTPALDTVKPVGGLAQEYVTVVPSAFVAASCSEYAPAAASARAWLVVHTGTLAIVSDNACVLTTIVDVVLVAWTVNVDVVPGAPVGVPLRTPVLDRDNPDGRVDPAAKL